MLRVDAIFAITQNNKSISCGYWVAIHQGIIKGRDVDMFSNTVITQRVFYILSIRSFGVYPKTHSVHPLR